MKDNYENITVDCLLKDLEIYKDLIHHINSLNEYTIGAIYLRVSTDMQTEYSPEAQLKEILRYCIQHGIMIPKENIFLEAGVSGTRADKRPEFQKMIAKAEEKQFKVILVHKFDRFARNREDSIIYKSRLRKKLGIDVIAIKELLPEDRKLAMMMESQLEAYGEYYSMNLSDEVVKGQREKAERGESNGYAPFGYDKVIKEIIKEKNRDKIIRQIVINQDEAEIVKKIFEKFIYGESISKITHWLNNLGIKTKRNNKFSDRAVVWILNNPLYISYVRWTEGGMERNWYNPDTIKGKSKHESIISEDTWNKSQEILKTRQEIYGKRKFSVKHEHWLRGLIRCDNCGEILVKNVKSFQCTGYTHHRCSISHSITVKAVENAILEQILYDFKNKPINIEINHKSDTVNDELTILNKKLSQLATKEKRVKLAYEDGIDTLEEYKENKTRLIDEKNNVIEKINQIKKPIEEKTIREEVYKKCGSAYSILSDETVSVEDKTLIAHSLIEKIVFIKNERKLVITYK